jgi:hypothetical protein
MKTLQLPPDPRDLAKNKIRQSRHRIQKAPDKATGTDSQNLY